MNHTLQASPQALDLARRVIAIEAAAVAALAGRIGEDFLAALDLILRSRGRIIVSGIGKSGHIARKIAATFSSTGTPAYFVHPAEASHGDLGMIARGDILIALSNSGESEELLAILPIIKRQGGKLIAITGKATSSLASQADAHLDVAVQEEACPLNLAPTASTTAALAMGDALAVALLDARGFGADDFARSHPGGALGRRLLTRVRDVMRLDPPTVDAPTRVIDAIFAISRGGMGMAVVVDAAQRVIGIFTDGDLRRALANDCDLRTAEVGTVMTPAPHSIAPDRLAVEAVAMMEQFRINQLPVVDETARLIGALNMHDLFTARVV